MQLQWLWKYVHIYENFLGWLEVDIYNHGQNIWDKLLFSCQIVHYGKSSISIFLEFFVTIDKIFILGETLGIML